MRTYEIPDDLSKDDEKWFGLFTNKALLSIVLAGVAGLFLLMILSLVGLKVLGIIILIVLMVGAGALTSITIPTNRTMTGGGLYLWEYIVRWCIYKWNRVIYVKYLPSEVDAIKEEMMEETQNDDNR